jgi:ribosomal protein L24
MFDVRASRYIRVKKNHLTAQLFVVYFVRPIHVSGVTTAHHQQAHRKHTTIGTNWNFQRNKKNRRSSKKNNKYQLL